MRLETREFKHPKSENWERSLVVLFFAVAGVVLIWLSASSGNIKPALVGVVLGGGGISYCIWERRQITERVVVSDQGIEAVNYSGNYVRLNWTEVRDIVQFNMATQTGPIRIVRLVPFERNKRIVLTGRMEGFDELIEHIHAKTPHARTDGKPTLWERFAWGAKS